MHKSKLPSTSPRRVLNGTDIRTIEDGAGTLSGDWYVDSVIDLKRPGKPRVWVRSHGPATIKLPAISFERLGRLIWVAISALDGDENTLLTGRPFETFAAAFVYIWELLEDLLIAGGIEHSPQDGPHSLDLIV